MSMISFPEALDLLLKSAVALPVESCRIEDAVGRVLRVPVCADRPFPPYDRVMMDGFAVRSADLSMGRKFKIAGTAPAGQSARAMPAEPFCCLEVMTGAPVPLGADRIVPVEETRRDGPEWIEVDARYESVAGRYIHRSGSDAAVGECLLETGVRLGSREIGVAASCGAGWLEVSRLPDIAVVATGDELVAVDDVPSDHQIRQSNAHAIRAALMRSGYPVSGCLVLHDDPVVARERLVEVLATHRVLILTGAVSKGSRDFVPAMLEQTGCRRLFHGVFQRPGKPAGCWIGPDGQIVVALPGNPVSALTGLHALVLPALFAVSGLRPVPPRCYPAARPFHRLAGFTQHLPVVLENGLLHPAAPGNSGDFIGLLRSEGFAIVPPASVPADCYPFTPWL